MADTREPQREDRLVVEIMTMLRARAEDGQIHIVDDAVDWFIRDAIVRIAQTYKDAALAAAEHRIRELEQQVKEFHAEAYMAGEHVKELEAERTQLREAINWMIIQLRSHPEWRRELCERAGSILPAASEGE